MVGRSSPPKQGVWAPIVFFNIFLLSLLLLGALFYLNQALGLSDDSLVYHASVFLLVLFVWSLWSWRAVTGSLFDTYALFLVAAALFNGGQAFLEVFRLNEFGILDGRFSPQIILETLF